MRLTLLTLSLVAVVTFGVLAAPDHKIIDLQKRDQTTGLPAVLRAHDNGDGTVAIIVEAVHVTPTPSSTNTPTPTPTPTNTPTPTPTP
jgi:hypothetical protein